MVQYRISSGNDGGFFKIDKNTGFITTASNFKGKKGERFTIKVSAYDNHEKAPTNEAEGEATAQVMVVLVSYDVVFFSNCLFSFGFKFLMVRLGIIYKSLENVSRLPSPGGPRRRKSSFPAP